MADDQNYHTTDGPCALSGTATRNETATAWASYIAILVTIVGAVGGAAWSISGDLAQLRTKVDANSDAIRDVHVAVRTDVKANGQTIAASNTEIGRLGGSLDEHVRRTVADDQNYHTTDGPSALSGTATRNETATAWAPYIAILVTIVGAVGGAAWSISGDLAQLRTKVDANSDAIRDVQVAVRTDVKANGQAIAASNTEIGRLGGRLDEHVRRHPN